MTIGSSIGNLGNQSSGLNGLPASSNLGMPYDSQSSSVSSVSIPVTPSDVRASVNVAPTSTKQKKKWVHFIVMLSAHFKWGRGGGSTCNLHLKGVIPGRIGIWTCWFLRRGEGEERDLNPGHIGGRRALSPPRHSCSPCVIVVFSPQKLVHLFLLREVDPFPDCNIIKFLTFNNLFSPLWHCR